MKAIFSIFLMVALSGLALSGQAPEKRFVGNCSFSGFALLSDSTYRGDIVNFTDRFGDGYNLNQLAAGYEILDGRGLVFEVDTIHSATNFTADVSVTAKVDRGFAPFGSGQAYSPTENGLIPPSSQEQAGLSPTQKARVDRHNVVVMQSLIGGRDSVYSIASVPDTSGLSPVLGDAFVNATADTLGLYDGAGWVLFFGGSQSADGFTILGDGTGGDPFRVNTDSLHTKMVSMDGPLIHYLNPCEANIDLSLSGTLFYDSIRIGDNLSGLITEDDEVPFVVVGITEWPGYATFTLFASNVVPGVYFPGIYYAGELLWSDQVTVVAGSTDTVTVFDPPGQDSILVTRVCGTEISRDTIPLADVLPSDNVTGTGTTNRIPLWAGVQELGDSYLLQSADALTLDASKVFQFAGHTTAGRPTATAGYGGYNLDNGWFEGSNGTSWWYLPRTSLAGGIGTPGSVLLVGSDGSITEDNPNLFWNDPDNFLGIGTAAPASRLHIEGGTLSSANAVGFQHNATLDNVASFSYGQFHTYTSRSGANNLQGGLRVQLNAGYTGNSTTSAMSFLNSAASTGTNLQLGTGNVFPTGNAGVTGSANATTTGNNYGVAGEAMRGNINIGVYGRSSFAKNDASNIGVLGNARNTGTGTARYIGGFFGLITSTPTWESAALIADNGANADPIFLGMDNGSKVFSIVDGGNVGIGAAAAAPTARMHLPAGTTAASTSSLKINEGVNETTPVDGAINHVADRLNFTSGTTVNVLAHLSDITAITTPLSPDDVPAWDGSAFQPSGITSDGSTLVDILGEYPFIPFYGAPDAGADGYVVHYDDGEGGIILGPLSGYIPFYLFEDGQFDANGFNLIMNESAGYTIDGATQTVIFGFSNSALASSATQMVFSSADDRATWGRTGLESFFEITPSGEAVVNSNSIGLRAEWDSTDPLLTLHDVDIVLPNTGISTDNTDRVAVLDSGDALRYKETCRARLTETTPTALVADASYRHVKSLSSANLSNFTATDSTLTYTGTETVLVEIQYAGSIQYDESAFGTYGTAFRVFVGASGYVESSAESIIITDADEDWIVPVAGSLWVSLNTSDVVSLRANVTAGITVNLRNLNFTVKSL